MNNGNNHNTYTAAAIEQYLNGRLSPADMHAMEQAALEDPFLADALEGYQATEKTTLTAREDIQPAVADLQRRLEKRVHKKQQTPVVHFAWWKVAAVVFLTLGGAWFYRAATSSNNTVVANNETIATPAPANTPIDSGATVSSAAADSQQEVAMLRKENTPRKATAQPENERKKQQSPASVSAPGKVAAEKASIPENSVAANPVKKDEAAAISVTSAEADKAAPPSNAVPAVPEEKRNNIATNKPAGMGNTFNGILVDKLDNPVSNAHVQIPNLKIVTSTDVNGHFSFKAPDSLLKVSVASIGYETQNLDLTNNTIEDVNNIIRLKPSLVNLNEVAGTSRGVAKKNEAATVSKDVTILILNAAPAIPRKQYDAYLEKSKQLSGDALNVHGTVIVSFVVDKSNHLGHFRIQQSLSKTADAEAIRLVKDGPPWKLLRGGKADVSVSVKF